MLRRFDQEHAFLRAKERIRVVADALTATPETLDRLREAHRFLTEQLMPHERAEEARPCPALGRALGRTEVTTTMSRAHLEVERLTKLNS